MPKDPGSELAPGAAPVMGGAVPDQRQWFGHPRGLSTLFFTEFWERFSYYGMRALLILFMTAAVAEGGLGIGVAMAGAIYGLYTSAVYFASLPGGWVADKLWGQRKAVFVGGCIIAAGHFTMALPLLGLPELPSFFGGLSLIVIGTGLLKPNVSTMVGELYPEGGARRDAGFSIFYMGINCGALLGPILCGYFGEDVNWHLGFSLAGFGMVAGLIQYRFGGKYLGAAGIAPAGDPAPEVLSKRSQRFYLVAGASFAAIVLVGWVVLGVMGVELETFARFVGYAIIAIALGFFAYLLSRPELTKVERQRVIVMLVLFVFAALFWSGFEQAGSSMNLFAEDLTDRVMFGWEMPTTWLQSINPLFIIIMAPVFGWLWITLGSRNPSIPVKFALGLLLLAAGFVVVSWGAANASVENKVSPAWLIVTYFLHTCGELCLSPVGLSSFTKLAPRGWVGQMMGVWFIAAALGNLFAGLVAGGLEDSAPDALFWNVALIIGAVGFLGLIISPFVKRLMGDIE